MACNANLQQTKNGVQSSPKVKLFQEQTEKGQISSILFIVSFDSFLFNACQFDTQSLSICH